MKETLKTKVLKELKERRKNVSLYMDTFGQENCYVFANLNSLIELLEKSDTVPISDSNIESVEKDINAFIDNLLNDMWDMRLILAKYALIDNLMNK